MVPGFAIKALRQDRYCVSNRRTSDIAGPEVIIVAQNATEVKSYG